MDAWDRMTALQRGGEGKRLTKEHICIYAWHMDTDISVVKACGGVGAEWRASRGENGGRL